MAFCSQCGVKLPENAAFCPQCGVATSGPYVRVNADDDAALRLLLPIGRSGWAIVAGYLGLLSLLPLVGVLAVITGVVAVRDIRKHPERHGLVRAWFGIVMGALTTVLYAIAFFVAAG